MNKSPVLILGGGSDIGLAIAAAFAARGHPIQLAGRDPEKLVPAADDLATRHDVAVTRHAWDALETDGHAALADALDPAPGIVVAAAGTMGDEDASRADPEAAARVLRTNFEGPALALETFAGRMAAAGGGTLVGISSVAGDRGRGSNYVYGAAKAGFTAYLSGMRNRLNGQGVHVVTVKPGFVATKMTEGLDLPGALTATPEAVADAVLGAVLAGRDVIYTKAVWRLVMLLIRALPEPLFKRTSL